MSDELRDDDLFWGCIVRRRLAQGWMLEDIGKEIGCSPERVRQLVRLGVERQEQERAETWKDMLGLMEGAGWHKAEIAGKPEAKLHVVQSKNLPDFVCLRLAYGGQTMRAWFLTEDFKGMAHNLLTTLDEAEGDGE